MIEKALTLPELCLYLRNGIEIWIDKKIGEDLQIDLERGIQSKFIKIKGRVINVNDVVGIFKPDDLNDLKRRKSGQHKCEYGNWHSKDDVCNCWRIKQQEEQQKKMDEYLKKPATKLTEEQRKKLKEDASNILNKK